MTAFRRYRTKRSYTFWYGTYLNFQNIIILPSGGSFTEPCERVMPLLNIAMQGISLGRRVMEPLFEKSIKNAKSMKKIREKVTENPALKEALAESLEPCISLLNER